MIGEPRFIFPAVALPERVEFKRPRFVLRDKSRLPAEVRLIHFAQLLGVERYIPALAQSRVSYVAALERIIVLATHRRREKAGQTGGKQDA